MYYLHFHEGKQAFTIIPAGVTITEAYDGILVLTSTSDLVLKAYATGLILFSKKHEIPLSADYLCEMRNAQNFSPAFDSIKIKHD